MNKIIAISVAVFIIFTASLIFQYLKHYFAQFELEGSLYFIAESIKVVPLILGVLGVKYSWKKINNRQPKK